MTTFSTEEQARNWAISQITPELQGMNVIVDKSVIDSLMQYGTNVTRIAYKDSYSVTQLELFNRFSTNDAFDGVVGGDYRAGLRLSSGGVEWFNEFEASVGVIHTSYDGSDVENFAKLDLGKLVDANFSIEEDNFSAGLDRLVCKLF